MKLKKQFLYRLYDLYLQLDVLFGNQYKWNIEDNYNKEINPKNLFPTLFKVYSYLWTSKKAEK